MANRPNRSVCAYRGRVVRSFRQQADEVIVDRASALFARRGFVKTSVQDVADAVGLSKAGLLHHFPSKDALHAAVLAQACALGERVLDAVRDLPPGQARDRRAVELIIDIAMAHPGLVALMLAPMTQGGADTGAPELDAAAATALQAFGVDPAAPVSERTVRVVGALSALAVLTLAAQHTDSTAAWRPYIVATCSDALGHHGAGAPHAPVDQVEA
jgi:AcrR family transcriptional regulator